MSSFDDVRGLAFPFRIDPETGRIAMSGGDDKIRENVRLILGTRLGERPMLRNFGTRIRSLVHDPNDDVLADIAEKQAREALLRWEPRIVVTDSRHRARPGRRAAADPAQLRPHERAGRRAGGRPAERQ